MPGGFITATIRILMVCIIIMQLMLLVRMEFTGVDGKVMVIPSSSLR